MTTSLHPVEVQLGSRAMYSVPDASQVRLTCREGALWITLDNDLRDVAIEAGGEFTSPESRRALVYALQPSRLYVEPTERNVEAPASRRTRYNRNSTIEMFSRFQAMPLRKAAR